MAHDKAGNRIFRKVQVRVIFPDDIFPPKLFTQRAGPKQGFGDSGRAAMLDQIADQLDTLYPYWEFNLTELAPIGSTAKYVMTFAGYRRAANTDPQLGMDDSRVSV
jgi:hypothetical protein